MEVNNDEIKKSIDYKILVKSKNTYFGIGTIVIRTYRSDIYYTPSVKNIKTVEHVAWHANGQVHIKNRGEKIKKYTLIQRNDERQKISEIGFQQMLKDIIKDYRKLPEYKKKVIDLDVVFDVGEYEGPILFNFSLVSGKLIVAKSLGKTVPVKIVKVDSDSGGIGSTIRALGYHSGNSDVALQYSLWKVDEKGLLSDRGLFISHDMKISKLKID